MNSVLVVVNSELKRCLRFDTNLNGSLYKNTKIALQHKKNISVLGELHIFRATWDKKLLIKS